MFFRIQITLVLLSRLFLCAFARDNAMDVAALFKETREYAKAIEALEGHSPSPARDRYLGTLHYLAGNISRAQSLLSGLKHKNWHDYIYLGLCAEEEKSLPAAEECYLQSLRLKNNSPALYRMAKIYYGAGNYKSAAEFFEETIACDASVHPAYYYLACCYLKLERFEPAYRNFARALNFYPASKAVKDNLSLVKKRLGDKFFKEEEKKRRARRGRFGPYSYEPAVSAPLIRVGLGSGLREFTFKAQGDFVIKDTDNFYKAKKDKIYTIVLENDKFYVYDDKKLLCYSFDAAPVTIDAGTSPLYIFDISYGRGNYWHKEVDLALRGYLEIVKSDAAMIIVNILSIEDYLCGVLAAEISPRTPPEALKAQAVAARTIAVHSLGRHAKDGFDVCADVHCQVYKGLSAEAETTNAAVAATRGEILTYQDKPIEAFYHANSGGCLRRDAFGRADYLTTQCDAEDSDSCLASPYARDIWFKDAGQDNFSSNDSSTYRWQRIYDRQDLSFVFGEIEAITLRDKGDCAHYKEVEVKGSRPALLKTDIEIRNYFDHLRSSAFSLETAAGSGGIEKIIFWGAGFGHGAGMSQEGARNMAKRGYTYRQILAHYYPKSKLQVRDSARDSAR